MTSLLWQASAFCSHRFSRRSSLLRSRLLESLTTRRWRWTRRLGWWVWSAGAARRAVTGVAAVASLASSNSLATCTAATWLSGPWIAPLISLLHDDFACCSHHSPLAQIVVFVVWHSMCGQFAISRYTPEKIFFEWSWRASGILWWRTVFEARTFAWNSFERWCWLKWQIIKII